ncbi:MAG: 50S ribosomal protein L34 [Candidatus Portnoybacteria bacterium]|nr:50S ribosomal protein L34 [Candidatus Portnoybacteria bacterium]
MPIKFKTKNKRRKKVHGFLKRMATGGGRRVINGRLKKKRKKVTV